MGNRDVTNEKLGVCISSQGMHIVNIGRLHTWLQKTHVSLDNNGHVS